MSTVTYTKTLRNAPWLINYVRSIVSLNTLQYYSYNPVTSSLTFTFSNELDTATRQVLDTLVNNYNETQALTLTLPEISAFKFCQVSAKVDVPIASSGTTDVPFMSENYLDRSYFMSSNRYVYIQRPGTYLIISRVSAYIPSGYVDDTNVQYDLLYDDTRTEQGYLTYPNSSVYTLHRSVGQGRSSSTMSCVFTVNSATGTFIKIQARVVAGTSPISIIGDFTNLIVMNIPNASYFESTIGANITLTNNFSNLFLVRDRLVHYPFSHTVGQASVPISAAGWLFLIARATVTKTSGTENSEAAVRFFSNGQAQLIAGTLGYSVECPTGMKSTSNYMGLIPVNAGTSITMQAMMTQGSNMIMTPGETGYIAVFLNGNLFPQMSLLNAFTDVVQAGGPYLADDIFQDLTFTTLRTLQPTSPNNTIIFSTSSPEIVINDTGVFVISAHISINNQTSNNGQATVRLLASVDGGATYVYVSGSQASRPLGRNDKTSVTTTVLIPVSSGHRIKVQASSTSAVSDYITYADSCTVSLLKFSSLTRTSGTINSTFGQHAHVILSQEALTTNVNTVVEKCRLVTRFIDAGVYRVSARANIVISPTDTLSVSLVYSSPNGQTTTVKTRVLTSADTQMTFVDYIYMIEGVHVYLLNFQSSTGQTFTVSDALIEMWRS